MHKPNEFYLEYVPDAIAQAAIEHVLTTHVPPPPEPAATEGGLKRSSSSYLSHHRSFGLLSALVSTWLSDFTIGDGAQE